MYKVIYYENNERRVKTFPFKINKDKTLTREEHTEVVKFMLGVDVKWTGFTNLTTPAKIITLIVDTP